MPRSLLIGLLAVLALPGLALAASVKGTSGDDTLTGCEHAKVRGDGKPHQPKPAHPTKPIHS
jgi:hypothetical protein